MRMVEINKPNVMFIQETMGLGDPFIRELRKLLVGWDLCALDAEGASGGIITGWSSNCTLINSFVVFSGLYTKLFCKNLGLALTLFNVYGPYEEKEEF
jgi:hypothetical protein